MQEEPSSGNISFRDRLSTISDEGKRVWVFAKKPSGRLFNYRMLVAYSLLLFFTAAPFIRYKGDPLLLLNVFERKFILFGIIIWPQDFHLIVLALIAFVVFIVLFTVVFGRLFCGWTCPQTVFMEFVFRQIEYLIEGDYHKQKKLARKPWNGDKILRKTLKHAVFIVVSLLITNIFLSYLIGVDKVKDILVAGPVARPGAYIGVALFAGAFYFIFAFFREQVCTIVCPYGRLQGVLLDRKSIVVSYDYRRGEPRGKYNPLENRTKAGKGDCIDCSSCVVVCPTNIDIRNGTQLECINCSACIDACNAVMAKVGKPDGLVRYDSQAGISDGVRSLINVRSLAYGAVLTILLFVVGFMLTYRSDFETIILRERGSLFQEYGEEGYSNIYQIEVVNKTRMHHRVEVKLIQPEGLIIPMGDPLVIDKGEMGKGAFLLVIPKDRLSSSNTKVVFGVYSGDNLMERYVASFIGPPSLDKIN